MPGVQPLPSVAVQSTLGTVVASLRVGDLILTDTTHPPHMRLPCHAHAHPALSLVLLGAFGESFSGSRTHHCEAHMLLFKPSAAEHLNRYGATGARTFIIEFAGKDALTERLNRLAPRSGLAAVHRDAVRLYQAFRRRGPDLAARAELLGWRLLGHPARRDALRDWHAIPAWLNDVADQVRAHCTDPLSVTAIATRVGVHPVYLARVFRRHFGVSVMRFQLRARLDLAIPALMAGTKSIARIAVALGFVDQSHFTRRFAREMGHPPSAYQREAGAAVELAAES